MYVFKCYNFAQLFNSPPLPTSPTNTNIYTQCMYVCMYVCMCEYMHEYIFVCVCIYVCTYIQPYHDGGGGKGRSGGVLRLDHFINHLKVSACRELVLDGGGSGEVRLEEAPCKKDDQTC